MHAEYTRKNADALFNLLDKRLDSVGILLDKEELSAASGIVSETTLAKMLAYGGFPATESKAVIDAYHVLRDAVGDLQMAMCMPFEMAAQEAEAAKCLHCGK